MNKRQKLENKSNSILSTKIKKNFIKEDSNFPEYNHPFKEFGEIFCNVVLISNEDKEIVTDHIFLATHSDVFLKLFTEPPYLNKMKEDKEEKKRNRMKLNYPYKILSSALYLVQTYPFNPNNKNKSEIEENNQLPLPFNNDIDFLISLLTFGIEYNFQVVSEHGMRWLNPEINDFSAENIFKIWKFSQTISPISDELSNACKRIIEDFVHHENEEFFKILYTNTPNLETKKLFQTLICKMDEKASIHAIFDELFWLFRSSSFLKLNNEQRLKQIIVYYKTCDVVWKQKAIQLFQSFDPLVHCNFDTWIWTSLLKDIGVMGIGEVEYWGKKIVSELQKENEK